MGSVSAKPWTFEGLGPDNRKIAALYARKSTDDSDRNAEARSAARYTPVTHDEAATGRTPGAQPGDGETGNRLWTA